MYQVNEIFTSIEGEGVRVGLPSTFIRLYGCNIECSYCDTVYACKGGDYIEMSAEDILAAVEDAEVKAITLTGGEPLYRENVEELIELLTMNGFSVNIETNGAVDITNVSKMDNVLITMDWKTMSSGVNDEMIRSNLALLRSTDVLKFVVSTSEDLLQVLALLRENEIKSYVYISPVFGEIHPVELVEFILSNKLYHMRVQVQLHKIIWDPAKRGV